MIHHACALATAIGSIPVTVILPSLGALLMSAPSSPHALSPRVFPAALAAIPVAAIAVRAQEEDLPATGADDEAKRFHTDVRRNEIRLGPRVRRVTFRSAKTTFHAAFQGIRSCRSGSPTLRSGAVHLHGDALPV